MPTMTQDPTQATEPAADAYVTTHDPLFFVMLVFFAMLTTALPGMIGQPRLLPAIQAIALTVFMAMAVRRGEMSRALVIVAIWTSVQYLTLVGLTWLAVNQVEHAMVDGFKYRGAVQAWFYGGGEHPGGWQTEPLRHLVELAGILLGSLVTGGLVGAWFLVSAVDLAAYATGSLLITAQQPLAVVAMVPWGTLLRLAGYATLIVVLSEPLLTRNWSLRDLLAQRGRLLLAAGLFTVLGIAAELVLADALRSLFVG